MTITKQELPITPPQTTPNDVPDFRGISIETITGHPTTTTQETLTQQSVVAEQAGHTALVGASMETSDPAARRLKQIAILAKSNPGVAAYFSRSDGVGSAPSTNYVGRSLF